MQDQPFKPIELSACESVEAGAPTRRYGDVCRVANTTISFRICTNIVVTLVLVIFIIVCARPALPVSRTDSKFGCIQSTPPQIKVFVVEGKAWGSNRTEAFDKALSRAKHITMHYAVELFLRPGVALQNLELLKDTIFAHYEEYIAGYEVLSEKYSDHQNWIFGKTKTLCRLDIRVEVLMNELEHALKEISDKLKLTEESRVLIYIEAPPSMEESARRTVESTITQGLVDQTNTGRVATTVPVEANAIGSSADEALERALSTAATTWLADNLSTINLSLCDPARTYEIIVRPAGANREKVQKLAEALARSGEVQAVRYNWIICSFPRPQWKRRIATVYVDYIGEVENLINWLQSLHQPKVRVERFKERSIN